MTKLRDFILSTIQETVRVVERYNTVRNKYDEAFGLILEDGHPPLLVDPVDIGDYTDMVQRTLNFVLRTPEDDTLNYYIWEGVINRDISLGFTPRIIEKGGTEWILSTPEDVTDYLLRNYGEKHEVQDV